MQRQRARKMGSLSEESITYSGTEGSDLVFDSYLTMIPSWLQHHQTVPPLYIPLTKAESPQQLGWRRMCTLGSRNHIQGQCTCIVWSSQRKPLAKCGIHSRCWFNQYSTSGSPPRWTIGSTLSQHREDWWYRPPSPIQEHGLGKLWQSCSSIDAGYTHTDLDCWGHLYFRGQYKSVQPHSPLALDLTGRKQWVLGGGTDLTYTNGDTLFTVEIPDWSILKQDIEHHPHISIGYSSALLDLDNDGHLDWVVGAPTAGSGNNPAFPEQAGWVGWFEQDNRQWILRQEWTGGNTFAHFGWSLAIQQTDTKRIVFAGAPCASTVSNTICFQQVEK